MAMEGIPVHMIQRQLGHTNLNTTERYISHVAPAQVIAAMRDRRWSPQAD